MAGIRFFLIRQYQKNHDLNDKEGRFLTQIIPWNVAIWKEVVGYSIKRLPLFFVPLLMIQKNIPTLDGPNDQRSESSSAIDAISFHNNKKMQSLMQKQYNYHSLSNFSTTLKPPLESFGTYLVSSGGHFGLRRRDGRRWGVLRENW